MMQQYMKELEQDPFSAEEFVERLAYRTIAETQTHNSSDHFDPLLLHDSFTQAIKDLTLLQDRQQKKCERLEMSVRDEETTFRREVHHLLDGNRLAAQTFRGLDERMVTVAGRVLHLGDQLDGVNGPRARAQEAHRLLTYLNAFLDSESSDGPSLVFLDDARLDETAQVIQKLHVISKDLTQAEAGVKERVEKAYVDTERALINAFAAAQRRDDLNRMKDVAALLFLFKGYSQCVDAYIEQSQAGCLLVPNVFTHLLDLCERSLVVIRTVFSNPEQVMSKFVLNIYHLKLHEYISERLAKKMDTITWLQTLYDLYSKTNQLSDGLAKFDVGNDKTFLTKLTTNIFSKHTQDYIAVEGKCLKERSAAHLAAYYVRRRHVKRRPAPPQLGAAAAGALASSLGLQDLRRDIRQLLQTTEDDGAGGGTTTTAAPVEEEEDALLSDELAITLLQDTRHAFQRCQLLTRGGPEEVGAAAASILDRLVNALLTEHVDYAVELAVQAADRQMAQQTTSAPPALPFLVVARRANAIAHLVDAQYVDVAQPLLALNVARYHDAVRKRRFVLDDLESKINVGIDRSLQCAVNWIRVQLQNEQRRTDFRPDSDDIEPCSSVACRAVVPYIGAVTAQIRDNLQDGSGANGTNGAAAGALHEFGVRLHRTIYDHLAQFLFSMAGALVAACDINEYRQAARPLGGLAIALFDTLHALASLLLVRPENLRQVCAQDSLANLDRSVVDNFIQLRSDYKTQKPLFLRA